MAARGPMGAGLTPRLVLLLSLALAPLAAVSYWQTARVLDGAERRADLALLARTERSANPLQATMQRAFGAAESIAALEPRLSEVTEDCIAFLRDFQVQQPEYSFLGVVPPDGRMTCASNGRRYDFSGFDTFARFVDDPRSNVSVNPDAPLSGRAVLIVTEPVLRDDAFLGFVSLSVPLDGVATALSTGPLGLERPLALITVNAFGEVLTSNAEGPDPAEELPGDVALADLLAAPGTVTRGRNTAGSARTYAITTLVPDVAYAIGTWPDAGPALPWTERVLRFGALPLLMWGASLAIAALFLDRLVGRPIRTLSAQMGGFARARRLSNEPELRRAPLELASAEQDFRDMARSILQDEALVENTLRQKNVLLKEVHHRVKNNLQLISSIISMEGRRTPDPAASGPLLRLQDRIVGLSLVHRAIYQSDDLGHVDLASLLREIAAQTGDRAADVALDLEAGLDLDPDRAVPLALLVAEALSNAARHGGGRIALTLAAEDGGGRAVLEVRNAVEAGDPAPSRLGQQLIAAFAQQLDGDLATERAEGNHVVRLRFPLRTAKQPAKDY